jgi:hypothetical protein
MVGLALYGGMVDALGSDFEWVGSQASGDGPHEGHVGWSIRKIDENLSSFITYLAKDKSSIVTLLVGTNDLAGSTSMSAVSASLIALESLARRIAKVSKLVLVTVPPYPAKSDLQYQYNNGIEFIARQLSYEGFRVEFADTRKSISETDLGTDRLHLTQAGIRKEVVPVEKAILRINRSTLQMWGSIFVVAASASAIGYWLYKTYLVYT